MLRVRAALRLACQNHTGSITVSFSLTAVSRESSPITSSSRKELFTEKKLEEFYDTNCPDNVRTKKQLIRCIGFPISVTREGDVEKYFYILEFVGFNSIGGSFDGFTVELKKNKIINVSGYI